MLPIGPDGMLLKAKPRSMSACNSLMTSYRLHFDIAQGKPITDYRSMITDLLPHHPILEVEDSVGGVGEGAIVGDH